MTDVLATGVNRQGLAVNIGGNTAHHVMTGRHDRHGLLNRIRVGEGTRQLTDSRQPTFQHFLAQMIQFEQYIVAIAARNPGPR